MFLKLNAAKFLNDPVIEFRTASSNNIDQLSISDTSWNIDSLVLREIMFMKHHLEYLCQQVYHNDLAAYLVENRSAIPENPFLSPIRALRSIRDYLDVDALVLPVAAHTNLAIVLKLSADENFHSARELFDAVTECSAAVNLSYLLPRERSEFEPTTGWRLESVGSIGSVNKCSALTHQKLQCTVDSDGTNKAGLLLLLSYEGINNSPNSSSVFSTRLVFDVRTLFSKNRDASGFRTLQRPLTIALDTKQSGETILLRLTLIVASLPQVELLGPFELVCLSCILFLMFLCICIVHVFTK